MPRSDRSADGFRYAETHEAGVYLVRVPDQNPPGQMAFAVNIDPAESDPATLADPRAPPRFGTRPLLVCEGPERLAETMQHLREGTSLWEWFLSAVLIGLVLEVFLANRRSGTGRGPRGNQGGWCNSRPVCRTWSGLARDRRDDRGR